MIKNILYIFLISMVPVIELRGAIPFGVSMGVPLTVALLVSILGNLAPVPVLIMFTRKVFKWLRSKSPGLERLVSGLEKRAAAKARLVRSYELLGLFILVAIPIPGTGAWTGALVAAVCDIRLRTAFPIIALGVVAAGIIVTVITYGVTVLF